MTRARKTIPRYSRLWCLGLLHVVLAFAGARAQNVEPDPRGPVARTTFDGPWLEFEFPGLEIGVAEYDEGPTGVTLFYFPARVMAVVDTRGGAPGTINTDALRLGYENRSMDAIVFAGGSWNGLAAATGVANEIRARRTGPDQPPPIVGVAGAIINDLSGARRFSGVTPDDRLGRAALTAAGPGRFPMGAHGAGRFAMIGGMLGQLEPSGQGAAVRSLGPTRVGVFTVVNAAGFIVDRAGRIARCRSEHFGDPCSRMSDLLERRLDAIATRGAADTAALIEGPAAAAGTDNTTLTLVVTNQRLDWWALQRLAIQVHTSMARAIQPFSTAADGDVLYAVTTGEVDNPRVTPVELGLLASELAWDAVLSALPAVEPIGPLEPIELAPDRLGDYPGVYELGRGTRIEISRSGDGLAAQASRTGIMYVPGELGIRLTPVAPDEFRLESPRRDRLRFQRGPAGRVTGLRINPGAWAIPGRRLQ